MAEQDIYNSRLGGGHKPIPSEYITSNLPSVSVSGSGAEQDVYGSHFRSRSSNTGIAGTSYHPSATTATTSVLGLLQSAVLPSFSLHAGLSAVAYGAARYADRAEGKDWLWPAGATINAWWSALGARVVYDGLSVPEALASLTYSQKLLLAGVTAWGGRLFYRVASRSLRRGEDDPRYVSAKKKDPGFWNKAAFSLFLPEAVVQTLVSLPFTLPFRAPAASAVASPIIEYGPVFQGLAVFLFSAGFALETIADVQLEAHKQKKLSTVNREGVWSIVRHPNYLGDALIHASFPILLLGAGLLHPLTILGPVANYVFLRYVGGDRENEESQEERYSKGDAAKAANFAEYRRDKNSFWPAPTEFANKWTWIVAGLGLAGVAVERGLRSFL